MKYLLGNKSNLSIISILMYIYQKNKNKTKAVISLNLDNDRWNHLLVCDISNWKFLEKI